MRVLVAVFLCAASNAVAVKPGDTLFIKTKEVALHKQPTARSASLLKLALGTEVTWLGPSEKDKLWHLVEVNGKQGFVQRADLSPNRAQAELDSSTLKPMSAQAFASSGAARSDTFGNAPWKHSFDPKQQEAAAELISLEELNKAKATPAAVEKKNKELHQP
jgi:hypothetical protein